MVAVTAEVDDPARERAASRHFRRGRGPGGRRRSRRGHPADRDPSRASTASSPSSSKATWRASACSSSACAPPRAMSRCATGWSPASSWSCAAPKRCATAPRSTSAVAPVARRQRRRHGGIEVKTHRGLHQQAGLRLDAHGGHRPLRPRRGVPHRHQPDARRRLPDHQRLGDLGGRRPRGHRERRPAAARGGARAGRGRRRPDLDRAPGQRLGHRRARPLARRRPGAPGRHRQGSAGGPPPAARHRSAGDLEDQPRGSADHVDRPLRSVSAPGHRRLRPLPRQGAPADRAGDRRDHRGRLDRAQRPHLGRRLGARRAQSHGRRRHPRAGARARRAAGGTDRGAGARGQRPRAGRGDGPRDAAQHRGGRRAARRRSLVGRASGGTPVYLKDVALVEDGFEDIRRVSRFNGQPAQGLGIRKQRGANAVVGGAGGPRRDRRDRQDPAAGHEARNQLRLDPLHRGVGARDRVRARSSRSSSPRSSAGSSSARSPRR